MTGFDEQRRPSLGTTTDIDANTLQAHRFSDGTSSIGIVRKLGARAQRAVELCSLAVAANHEYESSSKSFCATLQDGNLYVRADLFEIVSSSRPDVLKDALAFVHHTECNSAELLTLISGQLDWSHEDLVLASKSLCESVGLEWRGPQPQFAFGAAIPKGLGD